ncbi:MAG: hypothetical protein J6C39_00865, partial [Clostridia bacterium]|nr:hypothetical protein [Clostridia bacterium]
MKKYLKALFAFIISIAMLTSCSIGGNGDTGDAGSGNGGSGNTGSGDAGSGDAGSGDTGSGDSTTAGGLGEWVGGAQVHYRGDGDVSLETLGKRFSSSTSVRLVSEREGERLFILGEYDSELSRRAYTKLNRVFSESESSAAFAIYTDGKSVAIAYESYVGRAAALDYFFGEFYNLNIERDGAVCVSEFDVSDYLDATRNDMREAGFSALESRLSEGAVGALRDMYS